MSSWQIKMRERQAEYMHAAAGYGEVAQRRAEYITLIDVTGQMFDECLGLQLYDRDELMRIWEGLLESATEANRPAEALADVIGWVAIKNENFQKPSCEWAFGRELYGKWWGDGQLAVIPSKLDEYLVSKGYDPGTLATSWHERKWLIKGEGRNLKRNVKLGGVNVRCYVFPASVTGTEIEFDENTLALKLVKG